MIVGNAALAETSQSLEALAFSNKPVYLETAKASMTKSKVRELVLNLRQETKKMLTLHQCLPLVMFEASCSHRPPLKSLFSRL